MNSHSSLLDALRRFRVSAALAAVVYLVLGVFLLFAPDASRTLLCSVIGIGVTVYGAFSILTFLLGRGQSDYTLDLLLGVCAFAFGVFSLLNRTFLMDFLFVILGLLGVVGSISGIQRAFNLRAFGYASWLALLIASLVTLALSLSVVFMPDLYGNMMMMVVGILLIVEAVCSLISLQRLSKFTKAL